MPDDLQRLGDSFRVQGRVIKALLMREILTRYGRHNIGFLWLFFEPMLFTLGITALWTFTKALHGSTLPIAAFALTGYSSVLLWRNMPARTIDSVEPNLSLLFHRNVRVIDIFAARIILEMAGASMSFLVLSIAFIFVGLIQPPENILLVLYGWFMIAWFGAALALFLGALSERNEIVDKLWHPIGYLLFPLSGAAYFVDALPVSAQNVVLWLPMVHGVEAVRDGYFGSQFTAHYNATYVFVFSLFLTLAGFLQVTIVGKEVIPE